MKRGSNGALALNHRPHLGVSPEPPARPPEPSDRLAEALQLEEPSELGG